MAANELYHHGIRGQKWGVRRYQNYDGTSTEFGKKRRRGAKMKSDLVYEQLHEDISPQKLTTHIPGDDDGLSLKKGDKVYHVTPKEFKKMRKGQDLYVSATDLDRHTYRAYLTLMLKHKGFGLDTPIKELEISLKEDLNAPSNKDQQRIFSDVYKSNKDLIDSDLNSYYDHHKNRPSDTYDAFIKSLDESSKSKSVFYDEMKKNGYNAVLDQHDVTTSWMGAYKPLIVMDALNTFGDFKVNDISNDDVRESIKKLGERKK